MELSAEQPVSPSADLVARIRRAADASGITIGRWLTNVAEQHLEDDAEAHRLKIEAGLAACAAYEAEFGPFTEQQKAEANAWVRRALGR